MLFTLGEQNGNLHYNDKIPLSFYVRVYDESVCVYLRGLLNNYRTCFWFNWNKLLFQAPLNPGAILRESNLPEEYLSSPLSKQPQVYNITLKLKNIGGRV